jgi:hypothetical protein
MDMFLPGTLKEFANASGVDLNVEQETQRVTLGWNW